MPLCLIEKHPFFSQEDLSIVPSSGDEISFISLACVLGWTLGKQSVKGAKASDMDFNLSHGIHCSTLHF